MTSIQEKIQDASARNSELLAGLHETDSAPSQLKQQVTYVTELQTHIQKAENNLKNLQKKTRAELDDHNKYSESTFRRFAHKASGRKERFAEKAAKEEREYFDAIQAQKAAEDELAYTKQLHAEAVLTKDQYETQAKRHEELQRELEALYNSIFSGATPEFPFEDSAEQSCNTAHDAVQSINATLERERHVLFLIQQIMGKLSEVGRHLAHAHSNSQFDVFGGGGFASMMKRNDLEQASSSIKIVRTLQNQLMPLNSQAADLGPLQVDTGSIWGDVVFDNIFTDLEMHDQIKRSEQQLKAAVQKCRQHIHEAEERAKAAERDLGEANEVLKGARIDLQKAREEAFRRVVGGEEIRREETSEAPPPYDPPAYSA
ncbi:hypothetical protein BS50DRAFT_575330 [Corynespora cassiicola Philippines]|uniref:Uncharacterized protein n=1 Tax=Corynespora cassiicola Philippines TaxID=1448308 RepID=A0A2T2NIN2_CORCC|nr:hypothetical protein BS50DRAFT_575330 [Corynespora cassiicola Philippines]